MHKEKDPASNQSDQEMREYSFIRAFGEAPTDALGIGKVRFAIALTIRMAQILSHPNRSF